MVKLIDHIISWQHIEWIDQWVIQMFNCRMLQKNGDQNISDVTISPIFKYMILFSIYLIY